MMITSEEILTTYEAMVALTDKMLTASEQRNWDQLDELEECYMALVLRMKLSQPRPALTADARSKKVEIIGKMLENDRKIRDLTMPWMARLSAMLQLGDAEVARARARSAANSNAIRPNVAPH